MIDDGGSARRGRGGSGRRLDREHGALQIAEARWLGGAAKDVEDFGSKHSTAMAADIDGQPVYLAKSAWDIGYVGERFPKVEFQRAKERA